MESKECQELMEKFISEKPELWYVIESDTNRLSLTHYFP